MDFESDIKRESVTLALDLVKKLQQRPEYEEKRNVILINVIKSMQNNTDVWMTRCPENIYRYGSNLIETLREITDDADPSQINNKLEDLLVLVYSFRFEFRLNKTNPLKSLIAFDQFYIQYRHEFSIETQKRILWTESDWMTSHFVKAMDKSGIQTLIDVKSEIGEARNELKNSVSEINKNRDIAEKLNESLKKTAKGFNFVGLHDGFNELSDSKEQEKKSLFNMLKITSLLILSPSLFEIGLIFFSDSVVEDKYKLFASIIAASSVTLIFIYFFRIILYNYNAVKTNLLQIEFRKTLCRFIQEYSETAKELRSNDQSSLEKFENIIFSGLVSNEEKLPSTFDGLNELEKLVKAMRGGK